MISPRVVDLRSDTLTRPTEGMREAMAAADVGDDVLDGDPTVRRLEERVAGMLGKDVALFFPSGIMANEAALLAHTEPGTEVVTEHGAHILDWEDGAPAHWAGVQLRPVPASEGLPDPAVVAAAIRPEGQFAIRTSLLSLENTHNAAGGRIMPLEVLREVAAVARGRGIPVHLDGARLWNASVATGVAESDFAAEVDTVMVTLSKGLGCPVGSLVAGPERLRERLWRFRRRLGGAMRQSGILAAAGLYALEHHRERLAQDHERARRLGDSLRPLDGIGVIEPDTNILMIDLPAGTDAPSVAARLRERGVLGVAFSATRLRLVTHMDLSDDDVDHAAAALIEILAD